MKSEFSEGSILIRPYGAADVEPLFAAARESVNELSRWLPWCHANYAIEESRQFVSLVERWWQDETEFVFGIFDSVSGEFLGGTGLNQINRLHQVGNLGYWVRTSASRRGVASTAARLVARFGFAEVGLKRIEILAAVENLPSQRVAAKVGALREGVLRRRLLLRGQSHDAVLYSLIADDLLMSGKL